MHTGVAHSVGHTVLRDCSCMCSACTLCCTHPIAHAANVLVGANGALKLGDLGLGRQLSEQTMEAFSKVSK